MFIDDDEMRQIFKEVSEERLQKLEEGLLYLEKNALDQAKLNDLLREAHSLKGDANMLGVKDVGTLSHTIEDILGGIKKGDTVLSAEISDRLYQGLDSIRKLVREAVTGEPSGVNVFQSLAHLMGAAVKDSASDPSVVAANPEETAAVADSVAPEEAIANEQPTPIEVTEILDPDHLSSFPLPQPAVEPITIIPLIEPVPTSGLVNNIPTETNLPQGYVGIALEKEKNGHIPTGSYRIETIRVETHKLDTLMTQAGELTVSKIRIAHRLNEIEEIVNLWEEWSRDAFVNRFSLKETQRGEQHGFLSKGNSRNNIQNFANRTEERLEKLGTLINRLRSASYEDNARLEIVATELEEGIRTLRLLPLSTIFNIFPRMVRDLARQQGKVVNMIIEGGETRADKRILEEMKDPLMHMIRNAIDHGIETPEERKKLGKNSTATLILRGYNSGNNIVIELADDGRGLAMENIKQTALKRGICRPEELPTMTPSQIQSLIFAPGFSTRTFVTEVSGRGVGLDVVRTNVESLKGSIQVESTPGIGATFRLQIGSTLATAHVLIVEVDGVSYAIPVEFVETTLLIQKEDIYSIHNRETITLEDQPVSIVSLADLLELSSNQLVSSRTLKDLNHLPCIILKIGEERLGVVVNALLDEQDVVLKPQSKLLKRIRNVSGATILGTGEVCMVLNPQDMLKSVRRRSGNFNPKTLVEETKSKQSILLVEDSITIRAQEKRILEGAGYEVVTAVDGLDGYNKLRSHPFDAVVSDIEMPNLDGLSLTMRIRQHKEFTELPIILVTSLSREEDKKRGAEAGANAYITKGTFDQKVLLETLRRLI
jgi:two-component system chemotaxis sensor kinase CheA